MKIAAAVVTHNRLNDLKICVNNLRHQTFPLKRIIVVDNQSTDGTTEWLKSQPDIDYIIQKNTGSAGGLHTALNHAEKSDVDYIYCLDDDCFASLDAIEKILKAKQECNLTDNWILTSYVYDENSGNYGPLADFYSVDFKKPPKKCFYEPNDIPVSHLNKNIYLNWGHFFLGVLIPIQILRRIGFPEKKYFIRGEDYEYLLRCLKYANVGCVLDSRVNHGMPSPHAVEDFKKLDLKHYFQMRNHLYINRLYYPSWKNSGFFRIVKYLYLALIDVSNLNGFDILKFYAFIDSLTGNFNRFNKELNR